MSQAAPRKRSGAVPFRYLKPAKRRATQYEEVTLHSQWDPGNYAAQGWFNLDENGRPPFDAEATLLRAEDWWAYRDPSQEWFRPFVDRQAATGDAIKQAIAGAHRAKTFEGLTPGWVEVLKSHYATYRFPEYGIFLAFCHAQREAMSDVVAGPIVFQGLEKDRHAQDIALYGMELEQAIEGFSDAGCQTLWMESPLWQPTRKWIEELLAARDWGEINFATNLVYEPLVATLFVRELLLRSAPYHGDSVTPVLVEGAEKDREVRSVSTAALVQFLIEQDPSNRDTLDRWVEKWSVGALDACRALAPAFETPEHPRKSFDEAFAEVVADWQSWLQGLDLRAPEVSDR